MEKYQKAYKRYLSSCRKYGIDKIIDFSEFVKNISDEQVDQMLAEVVN